ncbi:hypothetical protein CIC12_23775 [Burkholderia sp. SG-MS1]|uniref:hypothetical protein n=1 Tax=Paraburkholderia sp. SG-MS1 TaxID=2023741 RepID=UPI001447D0B8|nr:hypothetical protein [Paraburkholderia sp. SG-MS1]NKJ49697.1 hypothetical protein [Paraburkholderia sp. SG-MS1]
MRHQYATPWIWLFLLPLALDYKATDANTGYFTQLGLILPTAFAGVALLLIAPRFHERSQLRSVVTISVLLCVVGSVVAQLVQDNDTGKYLRALLPFVLFLLAYLVACRPWSADRLARFERALFVANLISLVLTFFYGMATGGGLDDVRERIISVTLLGLQAVLLHEFIVARRFPVFSVAVFAATVVVEWLSETRSVLVGTALLFLLALALSAPTIRHARRALARGLVVGTVLAGMAAIVAWRFPTEAEHRTQLIFASQESVSGTDLAAITRLAEMRDQYDQVTASADTLLFGEGFGHYYRYSPVYLPYLADQFSEQDFYAINQWAAGHNFWVYQFFAGGLVFGIAMPLAMLAALAICVFSYRHGRSVLPNAPLLPVLGRAIMLFAALPATTIGGNPLGPRFSGLIFGVALGLMIATYARLQRALPANTMRTTRAPAPPPRVPVPMPELPGRIHPGMGRADLASTLGTSRTTGAASNEGRFGALVPHGSHVPHANRPRIGQ